MTKVKINPGICGLMTTVTAESEDDQMVTVSIQSGCESIHKLGAHLTEEIDAFEACLCKPGEGPIYELAKECCPGHAACPVIAGIIKCMEVECKLALPKEATIEFIS